MTLAVFIASAPERDTLIKGNVVAHLGGLPITTPMP